MAGLKKVTLLKNKVIVLDNFSYQFMNNKITCIVGVEESKMLLDLLLNKIKQNNGIVDMKKERISYFTNEEILDSKITVYDYLINGINLDKNILNRKLIDSIEEIGLNENYLSIKISTLNNSEKAKIMILKTFFSDASVMIFDNPSLYLDNKSISNLENMIKVFCTNRRVTIIILTNDIDFATSIGEELAVIEHGKLITQFNINEIVSYIDQLKQTVIGLPRILEFIDIARQKRKINLNYYNEISELVKEVARHV